jgi:hypothetical protein
MTVVYLIQMSTSPSNGQKNFDISMKRSLPGRKALLKSDIEQFDERHKNSADTIPGRKSGIL